MKSNKQQRGQFLIYLIFITFLGILTLNMNFEGFRDEPMEVKVWETNYTSSYLHSDSLRPDINKYNHAVIKGSPVISIEKPSVLLKLLAPSSAHFLPDPLLHLAIIITAIGGVIRLRNYNNSRPFTPDLSKTLSWVAIFCFVFFGINLLRLYWFNNHIMHLTDNQYEYKFTPALFHLEFWIGVLLYWLSIILKKAEYIQQEQELTV